MLSLAAFRYRGVLAPDGGPIESLEEGELSVLGKRYFQANARLKEGLVPRRKMQIYGTADGSGMHLSQMVARHMAVSEALERWAYHDTIHSAQSALYGFHEDSSSNGMAAFPGLSVKQARRSAQFEAFERFCILNWWECRVDGVVRHTEWPHITAISFAPHQGFISVILFMRSNAGFYVYGHAAAKTFEAACGRARTELMRNEWAIRSWSLTGNQTPPEDVFERRAWYFSTKEGHSIFQQRMGMHVGCSSPPFEIICDSEISGPWSRYTTVWRFLLRPPSGNFMKADDRYFFW